MTVETDTATPPWSADPGRGHVEWVSTTRSNPWSLRNDAIAELAETMEIKARSDVIVTVDEPRQTIEGFGASFNELGWTSLSLLDEDVRDEVIRELFEPGTGAGLSLCRMPIGANDFSRDWYSYDETPGDLELADFSVGNDLDTLIPFIRSAQRFRPDLRIWASPWSPPTWMKTNKHYAGAMPSPWRGAVENGMTPEQEGTPGTDMFIQDETLLRTYAAYFGRFVDAYREHGIDIAMVMPQNEFNSAQIFPSCTWTPGGLARFIRHLGPEMTQRGVEIFVGTLEQPRPEFVEECLADAVVASYVSGAGFQWAGKGAIADVRRSAPGLRLYQTEQECGDGRNDWRYCRYAWTMLRDYVRNGAVAYMYWNISLEEGGLSRWGWAQNSFVVVDPVERSFRYTHEYYLFKHVSHYVQPGARYLDTLSWTGYENQIAFVNPDGSVVIVVQNDGVDELPMRILVGDRVIAAVLPADSFNTFVLR